MAVLIIAAAVWCGRAQLAALCDVDKPHKFVPELRLLPPSQRRKNQRGMEPEVALHSVTKKYTAAGSEAHTPA